MASVLVFGASSFIGRNTCKELTESGHRVVAAHRLTTDLGFLNSIGCETLLIDDITNFKSPIASENRDLQIDWCLDFSWSGVAGDSRNQTTQISNIERAMGNLQLSQKLGASKYIGIGSQAEYGPCQGTIDENKSTLPTTLYGASKLATYHLSKVFCESNNIQHHWMRIFSVYGPGDAPYWLIPSLIQNLHSGNSMNLTKGEQEWDYLHVSDAAKAVVAVLEAQTSGGVYNLGSGKTIKIRDVVNMIANYLGYEKKIEFGQVEYRPDQVMHLQADVRKLHSETSWIPKIDFQRGLAETVDFFVSHNKAVR